MLTDRLTHSDKQLGSKIYMLCDAIHDFLVWLRTGSNPADIDWFRSHTGNRITDNMHKDYHSNFDR